MQDSLAVTVSLTDDKVHFEAASRANAVIDVDYTPPIGTGEGYMPLELFLISLASCSAATIATLLRRMRKTVSALEVHARGTRREEHPTAFERIELEFAIASDDVTPDDVDKAILLSRETYCPVWAMLRDDILVTTRYRIGQHG